MASTLRVLHVEDEERDAALVTRHLSRHGYEVTSERVETQAEMRAALAEREWDVILCDYSMPEFSALAALSLLSEMNLDIPFIIISGTIGERAVVEAMRAGAHDYLMKDTLARLGPAIEREIAEAKNRRARREAEEKLRLQSAALRAAANAIIITDRAGKILWINPAFTQTTGYSFAEVEGKNPSVLKSGKHDRLFYRDMWETILAGNVWHNTVINRRKDGTLNREDLTITPICDETGTITHFVGIKQDVSEKTRALEAMLASEQRYRRLFESAKDGILILEAASGQIIDINPFLTELLGYAKEDLIGKELWQIGIFRDIESSKAAFLELQQQGYIRYEDLPLQTKKGVTRQVEFVSNSYLSNGNSVIQCNIRDITERKLAERKLIETNKHLEDAVTELRTKSVELASITQQLWQASKLATMGELSASIAHELNNPLATVALRTESLLMRLPEDSEQRKPLEVIAQEVDRMAVLVNNLLQFSRRSHSQISTLDPREEIANSLDLVHYHLRTRAIQVVREFAAELPTIQADSQQLRQIFLNLITNASDAMPEGGTLTVRAALDGSSAAAVALEFADSGKGISPENLKRIWDPFFTTKPEGKGTGLGLAICRRIVEQHGGTVEIRSQPGRGTTVRMVFPATNNETLVNTQ
ncbi:MAG TPA: PAS domain S-box protein [Pyrinomonadaceae bacterium]